MGACEADWHATARITCANAIAAASSASPVKTGIQASAFNVASGTTTDFIQFSTVRDTSWLKTATTPLSPLTEVTLVIGGSRTPTNDGNWTTTNGNVGTRNISNFGSCSVPEIEFGAGFDNRRETSFRPVDRGESNPFFSMISFKLQEPHTGVVNL